MARPVRIFTRIAPRNAGWAFGGETFTVSVRRKRFITLTLGDRNRGATMSRRYRCSSASWIRHRRIIACSLILVLLRTYLTSRRALRMVEDVIAKAEGLREGDPRFATLGIGLAEGELLADSIGVDG